MTLQQLALPGLDMRPTCVFCGQPGLVGQYSPLYPWMVCRNCSETNPYPIEVFEISPDSRDRSGLRILPDALYELRERRAWLDERLKQAAHGILDERDVVKLNLSYRELRQPIRRSRLARYDAWGQRARASMGRRQLHLPYCERCGQAHDRRYTHGDRDFMRYCQACEDLNQAETLWRMRAIFEGDDPETILDRLVGTFPGLFERGVLPDFWFEQLRREVHS